MRAQGELAATAVNAPMVSAEVLAELQPYVALAQGLGTAAVQLVGSHGFADVYITYASPRGGAGPLTLPGPPCAACHASLQEKEPFVCSLVIVTHGEDTCLCICVRATNSQLPAAETAQSHLERLLETRHSMRVGWCADDLDTRLLRAMVIKGILEQITTATVNLVNADLLAKNRGMRIIESTVPAEGKVGTSACMGHVLNEADLVPRTAACASSSPPSPPRARCA